MSDTDEGADEPRGRLAEVLRARRAALNDLRARGVEPFALRFDKDADAADLHRRFAGMGPDQDTGAHVAVAGRIVLLRGHGGLVFATLRDGTGDIQLFMERDTMGEAFPPVGDLDLGDIVGAVGTVITTRRGELSVTADRVMLLARALRPLPEKWKG